MYWLVKYDVVDHYIERREAYRPQHLAVVREAHDAGFLVLGGALAEPPDGAYILFTSDDVAPVEKWVREDPYVINGLVTNWTIRNWTIGVGAP